MSSDNTGAMPKLLAAVRRNGMMPVMCVVMILALGATACSSNSDALCGPDQSVGVVASSIAIGQYVFDETDGGSAMRLSVLSAINQLDIVVDDSSDDLREQASIVKEQFDEFLNVSDELLWNDSLMSNDVRIDAVVTELNSDAGVYATTAVDSYIAGECDLEPSDELGIDTGLPTLPPPPISAPTATDPPIEMLNVDNEARALGETIAALFGLEIESEVALCLGRSLSEVPDGSGQSAAEYQAQFQSAFDACGIDYSIPVDGPPDAELIEEQ